MWAFGFVKLGKQGLVIDNFTAFQAIKLTVTVIIQYFQFQTLTLCFCEGDVPVSQHNEFNFPGFE